MIDSPFIQEEKLMMPARVLTNAIKFQNEIGSSSGKVPRKGRRKNLFTEDVPENLMPHMRSSKLPDGRRLVFHEPAH